MTRRLRLAAFVVTAAALAAACGAGQAEPQAPQPPVPPSASGTLAADLDRIFDADVLTRALLGVHIISTRDGRVLYSRNAGKHVVPASNMKLVTVAVAAERLGWDFSYRTTLEASGAVEDGTLDGDLIVTSDGDPSILPTAQASRRFFWNGRTPSRARAFAAWPDA